MPDLELDGWIKIYLREIWKIPLLTREQEVELAERIKAGDLEARAQMITANLRLVVKIAQDYANYWLPLLDLISEWNIGLMKAVERFDPNKGWKLSTYAAWWIKQSIKRALANQSKTIRLPVHMVDKISKMRRIAMILAEELWREPTDEELAEEIGIDRAKLAVIKMAALRPASLDAKISDDNTEFGEIIGDDRVVPISDIMITDEQKRLMRESLGVLDKRKRRIIEARFWLNGEKPKTLEEAGSEFGLTRERARQLQNIALLQLRRAMKKIEDPAKPAQGVSYRDKVKDRRTHVSHPSSKSPMITSEQEWIISKKSTTGWRIFSNSFSSEEVSRARTLLQEEANRDNWLIRIRLAEFSLNEYAWIVNYLWRLLLPQVTIEGCRGLYARQEFTWWHILSRIYYAENNISPPFRKLNMNEIRWLLESLFPQLIKEEECSGRVL